MPSIILPSDFAYFNDLVLDLMREFPEFKKVVCLTQLLNPYDMLAEVNASSDFITDSPYKYERITEIVGSYIQVKPQSNYAGDKIMIVYYGKNEAMFKFLQGFELRGIDVIHRLAQVSLLDGTDSEFISVFIPNIQGEQMKATCLVK